MKSALACGAITIGKSGVHGYGVFANQAFSPGDIIEECYALTIKRKPDELRNYLFRGVDDSSVMPLGYGAIYNHADNPNMEWDHYPHQKLIIFRAIKAIKCGDELFHDYGEKWFKDREIQARAPTKLAKLSVFLPVIDVLARCSLVILVVQLFISGFQR